MKTKGWGKVLKFTYIQTIKAKSFIASSIIMVVIFSLMIVGANFLPKFLMPAAEMVDIVRNGVVVGEVKAMAINKVYVYDGSELELQFELPPELGVEFEHVSAKHVQTTMDKVTQSSEAIVLAVIEEDSHGYSVAMSRPESTELINNSDCFALLNVLQSTVYNTNLIHLGVAPENVGKANALVATSVNVDGKNPNSEMAAAITMSVTMVISLLLFTLIIGYGQLTAQAIATEKASRVMELLLTSVKPLAVIIGKVLATTLVALTTIVAIGGISTGMFFAVASFGTLGEVVGMVNTDDPVIQSLNSELSGVFSGFTPINILLVLVVFILGFLFYALISGLIGASVSKIEDLQTALQPLIYISLLGFYLAYMTPILGLDPDGEGNFLVSFSRYFPISSPFALPGAILTGEVSGAGVAISIAVLALCLGLFAMFVAKVYEHIILHNGDRVKIKDMIKMVKQNKAKQEQLK